MAEGSQELAVVILKTQVSLPGNVRPCDGTCDPTGAELGCDADWGGPVGSRRRCIVTWARLEYLLLLILRIMRDSSRSSRL
jgi:hypothetical protein